MHGLAQPLSLRTRTRLAYAVAALGALTTIATSAPRSHLLSDRGARTFDPGERVHLVVRASRAAVVHADRGDVFFYVRGTTSAGFAVTPDDAGLAAGPTSFIGAFASVPLEELEDLCPGEGDCDIGLDVVLDESAPLTTLEAELRLERFADRKFLFPEDRSFPEDATVEVLFE